MPHLPSWFPSSKSCYMKIPSGINTQCHIIWWCENCSRLRVGSLVTFPFLRIFLCCSWSWLLWHFDSLVCFLCLYFNLCPPSRGSLSGLWKYFPNTKKYQSNYYYDFSHGDGLPRPLCPAGLSPYSGLTLHSVHCLIEFSGFYWKTSKNNFIGKGPGEVKTLLVWLVLYFFFFTLDFCFSLVGHIVLHWKLCFSLDIEGVTLFM